MPFFLGVLGDYSRITLASLPTTSRTPCRINRCVIAAIVNNAGFTGYGHFATKAYVLSLSEAIARELQGTGVTVTALCPGATESGFQKRAAITDSKLIANATVLMMTSAIAAEQGYQGLMAGKL